MRVRLTPRAVADVDDAVRHYDGVAVGLGHDFIQQLDAVVERLQVFPQGAPPVEGVPGVRRARLRRFPYGLFYVVEDDELIMLRVLHARTDASGELDG